MADIVVVDGSHGEGGGQVIRTSVALSALTGKPVRITNIRAKRCTSGLRAQHVSGVDAVAQMCNAEVKGASIGSEEIDFFPESIETKHLSVKISTAGSIGLVLQALLIPAMHIKDRIEIDICGGATFGKWSPPLLYTKHVLFPILLKMGYKAEMDIVKHGHYPKGGAEVKVVIYPLLKLKGIDISERGKLLKICGIAHSSDILTKAQVSERLAESARKYLWERYDVPIDIDVQYSKSDSTGTSIVLWAEFENTVMGADCLGEKRMSARKVGVLAAEQLSRSINSGASVDEYMTDQLPPYIAFACGPSSYTAPSFTGHAKTNIDVVGKFLDRKFDVDEKDGIVKISVS